jgi:peroxiredoxin Q/BCP
MIGPRRSEEEKMNVWTKYGGIVALAGLAATSGFAADLPDVGDAAPGFRLPGSDGKTYDLEDFKGERAVVIAWFPKAFTGG